MDPLNGKNWRNPKAPVKQIPATNSMRAAYNSVGYMPGYVSTQGSIRLERNLSGVLSTINFDLLENVNKNGNAFPTELRLSQSDKFTVTHIGFFVSSYVTATESRSSAVLATYPNNKVFTGAGEAAGIQQAYAGILKVQIGTTTFVQQLHMNTFYRVPVSQQGVAVSAVATTGVIGRDTWNDALFGFLPYVPTITLEGIANYSIQVQLPAGSSSSFSDPAGLRTNFAALCFNGIYHAKTNR